MNKIALVDDDRNILTSVSMMLEAEGFEVETYNDGQAALDAFNKKLPDMAVLDIKMPRMDGMDLLQRIRQKTKMPVIFLTSKMMKLTKFWVSVWGLMTTLRSRFLNACWLSAFVQCCVAKLLKRAKL